MQFVCIPLVVIGLVALFSIPVAFMRPHWFWLASRREAVCCTALAAATYLGAFVVACCV